MDFRSLLGLLILGFAVGLSPVPASAQVLEQLQELLRPPPPPPDQFRGRGEEEFRERVPPPGPSDRGQRWDETRERMFELRTA